VNGADDLECKITKMGAFAFVRALIHAIHFSIIKKHALECRGSKMTKGGSGLTKLNRPPWRAKPYSGLEAIGNVSAVTPKRNPEIAEFNPSAWQELHYPREFDDNGYSQPAVRVSTDGR
jgi:hypothetical protein